MTDPSGNIQAEYSYDSYGRVTQLQGSLVSDFQYAGYYYHSPSGLSLTLSRAYSAQLGRWINRDPIEEDGGVNLYDYVANDPVDETDPLGTALTLIIPACPKPPGPPKPKGPKSKFPWRGPPDDYDDDYPPPPEGGKGRGRGGNDRGTGPGQKGKRPSDYFDKPKIPKGSYWRGNIITRDLARRLRIDFNRLGEIIHEIKQDAGLRGDENLIININTGEVYNPISNEPLGNLYNY
jgi:RHS repeat-associated protein